MRKKSRFLTTALIMGLTFSGIYAPSGSAKAVKNIDFLVVPDAVGISTPGGEKISQSARMKTGKYPVSTRIRLQTRAKRRQHSAGLTQSTIRYRFLKKLTVTQSQLLVR